MDHTNIETASTAASWTHVQPTGNVQRAPGNVHLHVNEERPNIVLDVENTPLEQVPMAVVLALVHSRLSRPRTNGPPTEAEVLSEPSWNALFPDQAVELATDDGIRFHVRTDSQGGLVPAGMMRFKDAASGMSFPQSVVGPCTTRGVGAGKIMMSRHMDRSTPTESDPRETYLVNVYLSHEHPVGSPQKSSQCPLRDLVFVPREHEEKYMSINLALARCGHGPTFQPVVGSVKAWSSGRMEVLVRTQKGAVHFGPNGTVHSTRIGAAGVLNQHVNRVHPVQATALATVLGDLKVSISLAGEQFRTGLFLYKAVLNFAQNQDAAVLLSDLKSHDARVRQAEPAIVVSPLVEWPVRTEDDACTYAENVLRFINLSIHKMDAWRDVPREIVDDHANFMRVLAILCPLMTGTVSFEKNFTVDDLMSITSGTRFPFTCVDGTGKHVPGPWLKCQEDVLIEWVLHILQRVHAFLVEIVGSSRVQQEHLVKKTIDIFVPSFEPTMQSVMLSLLTPRPGYDGSLSHEISDSTQHLFLSKKEVSGWADDDVREYQIPFFALSHFHVSVDWNNVVLTTVADCLRYDTEVAVHVSFDLQRKLALVPSFQDMMSVVVKEDIVDALHAACQSVSVVSDAHVELVDVPESMWGVPYMSMTSQQQNIVRFLFYKRLADIVSDWKNKNPSGPWVVAFQRYK